jgi:hypothetical protein
MDESFEMLRGERRSFFCPNKLWKELIKKTNDCISVSQYVRMAIIEKMIKEDPDTEDYIKDLMKY